MKKPAKAALMVVTGLVLAFGMVPSSACSCLTTEEHFNIVHGIARLPLNEHAEALRKAYEGMKLEETKATILKKIETEKEENQQLVRMKPDERNAAILKKYEALKKEDKIVIEPLDENGDLLNNKPYEGCPEIPSTSIPQPYSCDIVLSSSVTMSKGWNISFIVHHGRELKDEKVTRIDRLFGINL